MKSIYTIVYTSINSIGHERINLGIIMLNEFGNASFKYSQDKLNLAKKLLSDSAYKLIKANLNSIENRILDKGDLINNLEFIKSEYLSYLSNYSHNLVSYSEPVSIGKELNEENFKKLFEKFIYKFPEERHYQVPALSRLLQIKQNLIPKVNQRVNVDVELKADKFDFVMFNTHIDMIGKNDRPVLNQFIDFDNTSAYMLEKQLNSYIGLIKPLELKEKETGKYFIVGEKPKNHDQQNIWKHLNDSPLIKKEVLEIVNPDETEKVEEYLEKHNVEPYFDTPQD